MGLLTPLGHSAWETFRALLAGRRLTDRLVTLAPDTDAVPLAQALGGVSIARHTASDPAVELAERATREAVAEVAPAGGVGLRGLPTFLGTSKGAVHGMAEAARWITEGQGVGLPERSAECVALGPHGVLTYHLARRTGVEVRRHVVAACSSGLTALHQARRFLVRPPSAIRHPSSRYALAVTAEAALLPVFVHSYRRLGVLAPLAVDRCDARPLHADRGGFVLAEAGAAVLLERLAPGVASKPGQIELLDTAVATEAHDLVRPSPSMDALGVVAERLVAGRPIAAVHPHAPGTADHDPAELRVLGDVLRARPHPFHEERHPVAVYANKGALGHSLGAAGLVSFVIACLAARTGKLPPMPWLDRPIPRCPLPLSATPGSPRNASGGLNPSGGHLVTAAGFAGHVAGAILQRTPGM